MSENYNIDSLEIGVGLCAVDNLKPSEYFYKAAKESKSYDELENKLQEHYKNKDLSNPQILQERECDLVAKRIAQLINDNAFSFSIGTLKSIHKYLFSGIFEDKLKDCVGEFRTYNISKNERILGGDSVVYGHCYDIENNLFYLFRDEKNKDYSKKSINDTIAEITYFVADMWQIHPFGEGNTRTTAVFTIKMLRNLGFSVDNRIFKDNSKYFRDALVLANYSNVVAGVGFDKSYLKSFFQKLLINNELELKAMPNCIFKREQNIKDTQDENKGWMSKMLDKLGLKISISSNKQTKILQSRQDSNIQNSNKCDSNDFIRKQYK